MVWILNSVNRPIQVALGSKEMLAARNTYLTEAEAKSAQQEQCAHDTLIGNSSNGYVCCADCGKPHRLA